ncbi:uncharacterized protein LOC121848872, partial [Callorhinchus milii]|uniref:uncharacterized protein LOC121848872 n=1 Tax=Callorhinchus milii TaxID=7868 RepID=UPI001C3FEB81
WVCFFSDILTIPGFKMMFCQRMRTIDLFAPFEIFTAQGLMLLAILLEGLQKVATVCAFRKHILWCRKASSSNQRCISSWRYLILCMFASLLCEAWNLNFTVNNHSINFPPEFYLPSSLQTQEAGAALYVALFSAFLLFLGGFC